MEEQAEGKNERNFKSFGRKVDDFMDELNEATERLQKEFSDKYEELKVTAEKLKRDTESKEKWKEVEGSLRKAGDELAKAFKAAFKRG